MEHLHISLFVFFFFCSSLLSDGKTFFTHLNTPCIEDCKPDGGEYKCKTVDEDGGSRMMYCSPEENMDYWGRQCRADSMCGQYGENYCWCRINIFSWGFCGLVKDDKNLSNVGDGIHITFRHRNKRAPIEIKKTFDQKMKKYIIFLEEDAGGAIISSTNKIMEEAEELIKSKKTKSENVRIDEQSTFKRFNKIYYNLQVQINVPREGKYKKSTTLAQVNLPDGVPDDYLEEAFLHSLKKQVRVFIDILDQ